MHQVVLLIIEAGIPGCTCCNLIEHGLRLTLVVIVWALNLRLHSLNAPVQRLWALRKSVVIVWLYSLDAPLQCLWALLKLVVIVWALNFRLHSLDAPLQSLWALRKQVVIVWLHSLNAPLQCWWAMLKLEVIVWALNLRLHSLDAPLQRRPNWLLSIKERHLELKERPFLVCFQLLRVCCRGCNVCLNLLSLCGRNQSLGSVSSRAVYTALRCQPQR